MAFASSRTPLKVCHTSNNNNNNNINTNTNSSNHNSPIQKGSHYNKINHRQDLSSHSTKLQAPVLPQSASYSSPLRVSTQPGSKGTLGKRGTSVTKEGRGKDPSPSSPSTPTRSKDSLATRGINKSRQELQGATQSKKSTPTASRLLPTTPNRSLPNNTSSLLSLSTLSSSSSSSLSSSTSNISSTTKLNDENNSTSSTLSSSSTPPRSIRQQITSNVADVKSTPQRKSSVKTTDNATASPQVKAAIAAMKEKLKKKKEILERANSTPQREARVNIQGGKSTGEDAIASSFSFESEKGALDGNGNEDSGEQVSVQWGFKKMQVLVEAAKRSATLNLASRELNSVPPIIYNALIPKASTFHPSRRPNSKLFCTIDSTPVDLTISPSKMKTHNFLLSGRGLLFGNQDNQEDQDETREEDDSEDQKEEEVEAVPWYEQIGLKQLNLSNNELEEVEEELAGFDELELLDIHNNRLTYLPMTMCLLRNLTSLNLSSNKLIGEFPVAILSLSMLRELNLSSNKLTTLWSMKSWRQQSNEMKELALMESPSGTPESTPEKRSTGGAAFRVAEELSESLKDHQVMEGNSNLSPSSSPFSFLNTLLLSDNQFDVDFLRPHDENERSFILPARLTLLDLSHNNLTESRLPFETFFKLERLQTLDLSGNNIGDGIFDFCEVDSAAPAIDCSAQNVGPSAVELTSTFKGFSSLETVDLSRNSIHSLQHLESIFPQSGCSSVTYVGLPKVVQNLIKNAALRLASAPSTPTRITPKFGLKDSFEGPSGKKHVHINISENPLSTEQARQRAKFVVSSPTPSSFSRGISAPSVAPPTSKGTFSSSSNVDPNTDKVESRNVSPDDVLGSMSSLNIGSVENEEASATSVVEGKEICPALMSNDDPALLIVLDHYNEKTRVLSMASQNLLALPIPKTLHSLPVHSSAFTGQLSPQVIDLSRNQFTTIPAATLSRYSWSNCLRKLDLSRNKLSAIVELLFSETRMEGVEEKMISSVRLNELTHLDLSHNLLETTLPDHSSSSKGIIISNNVFESISSLAPKLSVLNLSNNRLKSMEGIAAVLLPERISLAANQKLTKRHQAGGGIKELYLEGNKIASIEPLCDIAQEWYSRYGEGNSSESSQGLLPASCSWTCQELDLRNNDIARLPPVLGHLPHSIRLLVSGNSFRVPKREVYEEAGGTQLLPWLKERL